MLIFFPFFSTLSPPTFVLFFFFLVLVENGMTSRQLDDFLATPRCGRQRRRAFQTTRCNLIFPSLHPPLPPPRQNRGNSDAKGMRQAAGERFESSVFLRNAPSLPPAQPKQRKVGLPHPGAPSPLGMRVG